MTARIDFNSDIGESFGAYTLGCDEDIIRCITSANVACGFHAGDPRWMRATVRLAEAHAVAVGAHPSLPDLRGFGRRNMSVTPQEAKDDLVYQIGALTAFTARKRLQHVKPHGALYNMLADDPDLVAAVSEAVLEVDPALILLVLAGTSCVELARARGVRVAREAFADRALNADGSLVARSKPGAVMHDVNQVVERAIRMVTEKTAIAITGEQIAVEADSICLHGDNPAAIRLAAALRSGLETAGVSIVPLVQLV